MGRDPFTEVLIDDAVIDGDSPMPVIDPLWWMADIYDGPDEYERSLLPFSTPQRLVFAMCWYEAEVCNGGHDQFFSNSTGIVWRDALRGFEAAGVPEVACLIEECVRRFGAPPSLRRDRREQQMSDSGASFDDVDDAYFDLDHGELSQRIMRYVRANREAFHFYAWVRKPARP